MRVFVSEYICGGAWPEASLDSSLIVEGRAMLLALVEDLLRIPDLEVVITWDQRLSAFPLGNNSRLEIVPVISPTTEAFDFKRWCIECDVTFVIAPEFHDILASRIETASAETHVAGCDVESTRLCSDKLRLAGFLESVEVSTIPTERFELSNAEGNRSVPFPSVIKPQDGAGSTLTCKASSSNELNRVSRWLLTSGEGFKFIRQPFIDGLAVSCAAIVTARQGGRPDGLRIEVLPPCQQIVSADGQFRYEGADSPGQLDSTDCDRIQSIVRRCCTVITGLSGYVGFDLLIPFDSRDTPTVVEINPRLTTGYLLWRKMCSDNLAARILESCVESEAAVGRSIVWKPGPQKIRINSLGD